MKKELLRLKERLKKLPCPPLCWETNGWKYQKEGTITYAESPKHDRYIVTEVPHKRRHWFSWR